MSPVERIIDANANRAREALRVMEEATRFVANDVTLTAALKRLRHDLADVLRPLDRLELSRDTPGDVGTDLATGAETTRTSIAHTALAAGKRLSEALRAIEEYGKLVDPTIATRVEQLRYRGYELERQVQTRLRAWRGGPWRVCVLLGDLETARAVLDGGADCVQLRVKGLDDRELLARATRLVELAPPGVAVVINDRPDVALAAGAHGVHLGQDDLPCADVRRLVGRQMVIGVSTSRLDQARQAQADGADYCGVGPMFPSATKPKDALAGPAYLREYVAWGGLPHLAISGITPRNIGALVEAGVQGVAVSAAVVDAADPAAVIGELRAALEAGVPA